MPDPAAAVTLASATADAGHELPDGWRWARLGDVAEIVSGVTLGRKASGQPAKSIAYLRVANVKDGYLDLSDVYSIDATDDEISKLQLRWGDVLLTEGGDPDKLGRGSYWRGDLDECIHQNHIFRVRFDLADISPEFVSAQIGSPYGKAYFFSHAKQTTGIATINQQVLRNFPLMLPPLAEQRRIAAILAGRMAALERARAAAEAQLAAARTLPAAELRAVFESDEAREWPAVVVGEVARVQSGYAFKSDWFSDEGIRLLRNINVHQGYVDWVDTERLPFALRSDFAAYELHAGDMVLSLDRPVVAGGLKLTRLSADDVPSLLLQRVGRFVLREGIDSSYLYTFLNSPNFIHAITQHDQSLGVPHVSPGQVESVTLPLPSITVQRRIAVHLDARMAEIARLRAALEAQRDAINALPAALLRQAFNGEL